MQSLTVALESTSSHGLPRIVSSKPLYVRIVWLLLFLLMVALFLKGFSEFVGKLRSNQVSTSLDANVLKFQLPDVYACFQNPISASYSANIDMGSADAINKGLDLAALRIIRDARAVGYTDANASEFASNLSFLYPQSLSYSLLVNTLAHRPEQSFIESNVIYKADNGLPVSQQIQPGSFYDQTYLYCLKWNISSKLQDMIVRSMSTSGMFVTLLIDTASSEIPLGNSSRVTQMYARSTPIPLSDWSMSLVDFIGADRRAGIRVFLTPPGEYPTEFVTSFSLGPGKHHTVEIGMTQQVYKDGQFDCVRDEPDVQFVNPYDHTPYNHKYSYSYCYYYECHRLYQSILNISGYPSALPWPWRGKAFAYNFVNRSEENIFQLDPLQIQKLNLIEQQAQSFCESRRPCSTQDYSVSISSADWPTQSSLAPFVSSSIKQAWTQAKAKNLSVPALDFLLTGNASSVASYVRSNLLKVHFKPQRVHCDRVTFSRDYGVQNFISDVGGIMGIYLGMSLLTLCELLELAYDIIDLHRGRAKASQTGAQVTTAPLESTAS